MRKGRFHFQHAAVLLLMALSGCDLAQKSWHHDVYTDTSGRDERQLTSAIGAPDYQIQGFADLAGKLSERTFPDARNWSRFVQNEVWSHAELGTYRDYVMREVGRMMKAPDVDGWYNAPPFPEDLLLFYDESRRFKTPVLGGAFHAYVHVLRNGRSIAVLDIYPWKPELFQLK